MSSPVALITGASRGIGAATAKLAASRGYRVAVNYRRDADRAEAVVRSIRDAGGQALPVRADISNEADVVGLFREVDSVFGSVDALVNNAGILHPQSRVEAMNGDRLREVLAVNVVGSFLCAREAVLRMSTEHGGSGGVIINVSSAASRLGSPNEYVDYAASKGAIDTMTIGLAKEVAAQSIRVHAVRPAFIDTEIHASGGDPGRVERIASQIPMQRGGTPEEVAQAITWLMSDDASYATGAIVDLAGGA